MNALLEIFITPTNFVPTILNLVHNLPDKHLNLITHKSKDNTNRFPKIIKLSPISIILNFKTSSAKHQLMTNIKNLYKLISQH